VSRTYGLVLDIKPAFFGRALFLQKTASEVDLPLARMAYQKHELRRMQALDAQ